MNDVVKKVEMELKKMSNTSKGEHIKTVEIRKLSAKLFRDLHDKSKKMYLL